MGTGIGERRRRGAGQGGSRGLDSQPRSGQPTRFVQNRRVMRRVAVSAVDMHAVSHLHCYKRPSELMGYSPFKCIGQQC